MNNSYRIKYWYQETEESGRWCYTGTMSLVSAEHIVKSKLYPNMSIVYDDVDFPEVPQTKAIKEDKAK